MKKDIEQLVARMSQDKSFSGVVEVCSETCAFRVAYGWRDRANQLPVDTNTRFAVASGTKGFTALGVASLLEAGEIGLGTTAASILGKRFTELHPEITIEQLLSHTSGIGDYYDEDETESVDDFILSIPVQKLNSPFDYLPLLKEKSQKFAPGQKACYSNGGYIVLAMIIELVSRQAYQNYIEDRVFRRANMDQSGFFRSDRLPENTALGYLVGKEKYRTNIFNLPVVGSGDGGAYTTLEDIKNFWHSLFTSRIVNSATLTSMIEAKNRLDDASYGHGFWIRNNGSLVALEGYDAGVSFYSAASPDMKTMFTVIANDRSGAWPILKLINDNLFQADANGGAAG